VRGGGVGADGVAGLGQVRGARRVEGRDGQGRCGQAQRGAVGSPVAQVVGDVRFQDGPQLLGVRVA
jgi:hypothetical protein